MTITEKLESKPIIDGTITVTHDELDEYAKQFSLTGKEYYFRGCKLVVAE